MKRVFDLLSATIGLIVLSPLFLVIALLIWLDNRGPVFYKQERVGQYREIFEIYKFRSMRSADSGSEGRFDPGDSSRVTKIGRIIRKRKLDELPQLYNVLKGDMSIVGPRPEIKKWVNVYPDRWERILTLKPGITDNASILFRNEEEILAASMNPGQTYREDVLPKKLDLYEEYVTNHSFLGDIGLIFKTFA